MATKSKVNGLNGAHTAGIFADMTVDGPEIGTLVVIVDRAKNLPNRKSIGKQDPYCAARLGKEAKKTETDRRGGQTPRWDQELRFTVHDSPDYYQLKVSVFNDDKKTDLIGETWVNLQDVIIPGGGQNDIWHNLNCKGKYAGELRIEITYYDTRPKQEKPEKARSNAASAVEDGRDSLKGPRQQKAPVKRRPLPSDPVTGAPPPQVDNSPPRAYQPPTAIPEYVRTPQRGNQSPSYIPNQSPLQSVEYQTPPKQYQTPPQQYQTPPQRFQQSPGYGASPSIDSFTSSPDIFTNSPNVHEAPTDRYELHDAIPTDKNRFVQQSNYHQEQESYYDPRSQYEERYDSPYELPNPDDFGEPVSPEGPPPPPPVHRSKNNSHQASPAPLASHGSYGFPPSARPTSSYEIPQPDMHRKSMPAFPQFNSDQSYTPPAKDEQFRRSGNENGYGQQMPRHNSYDSRYDTNYEHMQPTVEDAPPTPTSGRSRTSYDDRRYDQSASPAPLNLSGRGSSASGRYAPSTAPSTHYSHGYGSATSPVPSFRDQQSIASSQTSYNPVPQQKLPRQYSDESTGSGDRMGEYGTPDAYGLPPVPPTLVAGMDPSIAQEISERIYAEKRASVSYNQNGGNSQRGIRYEPPQYQSNRPHPLKYQESATTFVPAATTYDDRQSRIATATIPVVKPRAISPDPRSPARKSVSPAPPTPEDRRRLSGVPFGPDSYNALNPSTGSAPAPTISAQYDTKEDPNAKIITHDGREIDPSDHIPESNYAPLLETKGPKYASQQPDRNYRANPATGRMPLRQQTQRPSSAANSSPIVFHSGNPHAESSPPLSGRNRLQKKANRMSAQPAPQSSPLAPTNSYQNNSSYQHNNSYEPSPRNLPRSNTGDFTNENYAPQQYGSSPGYRGHQGLPIPAKVPNGHHHSQSQPSGPDAWALLEEMKNIDLGVGRARRRGGGY